MANFSISNGQIIDPNGSTFIARGINAGPQDMSTLEQSLTNTFPGANFVRMATWDTAPYSMADYQTFVNAMSAKGIVVEFEDHTANNGSGSGGGQGTIFTPTQQAQEDAWYASLASTFKNNPEVWFGTTNEPSTTDANGSTDVAALSAWQQGIYNAIRGTGNNSPVMLEANGWSNNGQPVMLQGYNSADYANMTSVIWDMHYYGWLTNYSTDQTTVNNFLAGMISQGSSIQSANGTIPVMIGEFGNSTTGASVDPNGTQVVNAVLNSQVGYAAWTWGGQGGPDQLTQNGSLTSYGQQVAAGIAATAAKHKASSPPSADDTVVTSGSSASITDAGGNIWTIVNGSAQENGVAAGYSAGVVKLAYIKGTVWQENASNLWWQWNGTAWNSGSGTSVSPLPTSSSLTLRVSEDAYQGDAQFTIHVDGTQVGGTLTASALHAAGDSNVFVLTGIWGQGTHDVQIQFLNDAYGGTPSTDRNLYVNSIAYGGTTYAATSAALMSAGAHDFTVGGSTSAAAAPADTLAVHLAEDAYQGNAQFVLSIDGKQISDAQSVTTLHSSSQWQDFIFAGNFGAGTHTIGITFINDAYGGTPSADRNLYVNGIDVNGQHYGSGVSALMTNSAATFTISTVH